MSDSDAERESSPALLAFVPMRDVALPEPDQVLAFARSTWPEEFGDATAELTDGDKMTINCLGLLFFIGLMPAPMPGSDEWGSSAWRWPTVVEDVRDHRRHAVVGLLKGEGSPVVRSALLTMLVASLLSATDSIGVCWGSPCVVNSRDVFIEQAKELAAGEMPLWLWVDFYGKKGLLGKGSLRTAGLKDLGLMEIEVRGTRHGMKDVLGSVFNMAYYLLDKGPVIKDGDTIGGSNEERRRVNIVPSSWDKNEQVYLLHL